MSSQTVSVRPDPEVHAPWNALEYAHFVRNNTIEPSVASPGAPDWTDGRGVPHYSLYAVFIRESAGSLLCFISDCEHEVVGSMVDEDDFALLEMIGHLRSHWNHRVSMRTLVGLTK